MLLHTRFYFPTVFIVLSVGWHSSAWALSEDEARKILNMHPDAKLLAELEKQFPIFQKLEEEQKASSDARTNSEAARKASAKAGANVVNDPPPSKASANLPSTSVSFMLRNDWSDLGVLGACLGGGGVGTSQAKGASVSFTDNYVANNRIWAAQAMGAAVLSNCDLSLRPKPGGGDSGFVERSVAVYAQVNSSYNSNATLASKNSDTRTAGLSGEIAYLHSGDYDVVRLTPNVVQDAIKGTTAVAVMGQYLPVWVSRPGIWHTTYILDGNVSYQFDPTFDVQYASTTNAKNPLAFSGKDQSLRLGPELTLIVAPFAGSNDPLSRIGINETFHPWYEAYSSGTSYWWANSIFYNITDNGNVAVAFSYNRGLDENSGTMTNQYVLSLTGKL
jgi:hypothetical protein